MSAVSSFDVFDTVLTRRVGDPDAVIVVTAERIDRDAGLPTSQVAFARSRKRQEQRLTTLLGRHATLREIYREVAVSFSVAVESAERAGHRQRRRSSARSSCRSREPNGCWARRGPGVTG